MNMNSRSNRHNKGNRSQAVLIAVLILLAIITVAVWIILLFQPSKKENVSPNIIEGEIIEDIQKQEYTQEEEESGEQLSEPQYNFTVEEVTVPVENLSESYHFTWVSDLHMITDHEVGPGMDGLYLEEIKERYEDLPVDKEGLHAEELWPMLVQKLRTMDIDGVVFGGDMIDYCSESNINALTKGLEQLQVPYLYIRADHDMGAWYGGAVFLDRHAKKLQESIDGNDIEKKYWEFDDFIMVGVDYSNKDMSKNQMWTLEEQFNSGKPVIVLTHVPYSSHVDESLKKLSMEVRNTEYYWEGEHYQPNEDTSEYLHMIYRDESVVKQVLAGHLHSSWDGMITDYVPQHIFGPAFEGNIGLIHVVPATE